MATMEETQATLRAFVASDAFVEVKAALPDLRAATFNDNTLFPHLDALGKVMANLEGAVPPAPIDIPAPTPTPTPSPGEGGGDTPPE